MTAVLHRFQCAAVANGCTSALVYESQSREIDDAARRFLVANGWRRAALGRWVCGSHEGAR